VVVVGAAWRMPFPPLVKGGWGGGQRATRHDEIKGTGGCSRRDQLRMVKANSVKHARLMAKSSHELCLIAH
jgi:hypothetical protein